MKVWIVHDSNLGNGERLAKQIGSALEKENHSVQISHIKKADPKSIVAEDTDMIIVGGAVRKFTTDSPPKSFIRKLHTELEAANKSIQYGATFLTHIMPKKMIAGKGKRLNNKLAKNQLVASVYPEFLSAQVQSIEGPFREEVIPEIEKEISKIVDWVKK